MSKVEIQAFAVHVHARGGRESYKGTPGTESYAALNGGFVAFLLMPNTDPPVINEKSFEEKMVEACESEVFYGQFLGGIKGNQHDVLKVAKRSAGLKIYMDNTTGNLLLDDPIQLERHFALWPEEKPICVHAEGKSLSKAISLAQKHGKKLHVCHVSTEEQVLMIKEAKEKGIRVTCEVTPHHLFLTEDDLSWLGPLGLVKPALPSKKDQIALWEAVRSGVIDCIADDHAPHTLEEKYSDTPPYGIPGLETTLPLMLEAVSQRRLTFERLIEMISINPKKIFGINNLERRGTYAVIDIEESYYLDPASLKTKCGWSPYTGHKLRGEVRKVYIAGEMVFEDGEILPRFNSKSIALFQNQSHV